MFRCILLSQAQPVITVLILLEMFVLWLQGEKLPRWNDSFSSIAAATFSVVPL